MRRTRVIECCLRSVTRVIGARKWKGVGGGMSIQLCALMWDTTMANNKRVAMRKKKKPFYRSGYRCGVEWARPFGTLLFQQALSSSAIEISAFSTTRTCQRLSTQRQIATLADWCLVLELNLPLDDRGHVADTSKTSSFPSSQATSPAC